MASFRQYFNNLHPLKFFLTLGTIFGLLFLFITPPFQGADEVVHFYRAYQVSEGVFVSNNKPIGVGGRLPSDLGKIVAITNTPPIAGYPQLKYNEHKTARALRLRTSNALKYYKFPASAAYTPVPYIGASTGILVSRILHLPAIVTFYAGRLGNLIMWLVLVALAIYYLPRKKWTFVAIGLLPMALFQAATLNGDAATTGSLMLIFALIFNYRNDKKILSNKQLLAMLAALIIVVLSKEIMFIFLPLVLLLGNNLFKSKRRGYVYKTMLILLPLFLFLGWLFLTRHINSGSEYYNHQNPSAQIHYILNSPFNYINTLWNTYFYTWGDNIVRSFIGVFGWSDAPLSELVVTIGYMGLAYLFITTTENEQQEKITRNERISLWALVGVYCLAVSTALYLYYSPVAYKIVYGLQGRYFIPIAVIASVILPTKAILTNRKTYNRIAMMLPTFLLLASTITLYVRYFIKNV